MIRPRRTPVVLIGLGEQGAGGGGFLAIPGYFLADIQIYSLARHAERLRGFAPPSLRDGGVWQSGAKRNVR